MLAPEQIDTLSDDECIAIAMLHGAEFKSEGFGDDAQLWYMEHNTNYAIERQHYRATGYYGFETRAEIARAYCQHYNLLR